jgi:hypothetical protein
MFTKIRSLDPRQVDSPLGSVAERVERADHVVASDVDVDRERADHVVASDVDVDREMVACARRDTHVGNVVLRGDSSDRRL